MRRPTVCLRILSSLALAILLTATAKAQWTRIGPDGGVVTALAAAPAQPATVYAGLRGGGMFRSLDGGGSWAYAGAGLGRTPDALGLAVDAGRPGTVYAITNFGLARTTNGGVSWKPVSPTGSAGHLLTAVAADPRRSGVVYVALDGGGILASADRGRTWNHLSGPPDTVLVLAIDPVVSTTLYAGTQFSGVFRSTDAGIHWRGITRGIHPSVTRVVAIAIDPHHPQTLFFATGGDAPYRSVDGGAHWTKSFTGLGQQPDIRALAIDPAHSATVFAASPRDGVFRSLDGGLTWRPADAGLPDLSINALLAAGSGLFVGSQSGVAASHDRALTWRTGRGLKGNSISSLAIDSQDPPRMYAFDGSHLFKSASRGVSWIRLPLPPPAGSDFLAPTGPVAVHPDDPQQVELGFIGSVARSDDGGRTWANGFGVGCVYPGLVVIDPHDPEVLYTSGSLVFGACDQQPGACNSYKFDHGQVSCLRDPAINPWGMPVIAVDPAASNHLFASGDKLYHSVDAGATWSVLSAAISPFVLLLDPVHSGTLYAGVFPAGVGRSADGGATWQIATAGLPTDTPVLSLAIDPTLPSTLYASTFYAVYRSTDSGATWAPLGPGLEQVLVWRIVLDPLDPGILYAATYGGGVMELRVPR